MVAAMTERLDAFERQSPTSDNHDTLDQGQSRQHLLVIGNGTQCCHSCQVHSWASECGRACSMRQKQTIIAQLLPTVEQYCMFFCLYLHDSVGQELDTMI